MGVLQKVKGLLGLEDDYDEEYEGELEDEFENEEYYQEENYDSNRAEKREKINRYEREFEEENNSTNKVIDLHPNMNNKFKALIYEPKSYDEIAKIVEELKNRKLLVVNMSNLDNEIKTNLFHCMSGAIFSMGGDMQKVSTDIFVLAPETIDVDTEKNKTGNTSDKGIFPWQD